MVEPYTTLTVPTEVIARADRACNAAVDVTLVEKHLECAEYRRRLEQAHGELTEAYREICSYVAESGGLLFGLHLAAAQLDEKVRCTTWHCPACESSKGGDRG